MKPKTKAQRHQFLGSLVEREVSQAEGSGDEAEQNRAEAIKYYLAKPRGDEVDDRSGVISTDVADMTNAVLAMLTPMLSTDAVVEFEPESEEDEAQARVESDVCNRIIIEDNRGYIEIQEAIKDALLMRNACMKVTVMDDAFSQTFNIEGASEEHRRALVNDAQEGETRSIEGDQLTITTQRRRFLVDAVPIENMRYQPGFTGDLQDIRFIAEAMEYTRSELVEMGIDKSLVASLHPHSKVESSGVRDNRDRGHTVQNAQTRDQDIIDCYEAYVLTDMDGDGISERYKVLVANDRVCLSYERVDLVPYAMGTPFINPHRITGESLFDHVKTSQDVKTALLRNLIDNTLAINNGRYIYDPARANEADILNPVAGGGIRASDPTAVVPVMVPDVTTGILSALDYEDKRRTERGGAALDMMSADAQIVGETAHGIERQYASREAMVSMMASNLSETLLRGIYLLTHEFLRRYSDRPFNVRQKGQLVETDPRSWPKRTRVNVKTGMSPGQRGHLEQVLSANMQFQATAMQSGMDGILATPQTIYRTAMDWLRMAGVPNPERHWIDPESPQAQQAAETKAQQQQEQMQMQMQLVQAQIRLEELKIKSKEKIEADKLEHAYYETETKVATEEAKLAGSGTIELEKERMRNDAELAKAQLSREGTGSGEGEPSSD